MYSTIIARDVRILVMISPNLSVSCKFLALVMDD